MTAGKVENPIVRALLKSLIADSWKHATYYQALIDLHKVEILPMTEEDKASLITAMRIHVSAEEEVVKETKKLRGKTRNELVRPILDQIVRDEEQHPKALKDMTRAVEKEGKTSDFWKAYGASLVLARIKGHYIAPLTGPKKRLNHIRVRIPAYPSNLTKRSFGEPETGQTQLLGISSNLVPGLTPFSGSPTSGS